MFHDFETSDLLSSRRDDVTAEDERTVSDLMVDQIEFADVIILNKIDMVSQEQRDRMIELIKKLNHRAKVIQTSYSKIDVKEIVNTGMFSLEKAQTGYGWLQDLHEMTLREVNGRKAIAPKPETEEYNVRNFVYTQRRPFHPLRLFQLLHDKFILQLEHPEEDDEEEEEEDEDEDMEDASDEGMEEWEEVDEDADMEDSDSSAHSRTLSNASTTLTAPSSQSKDSFPPELPSNEVILANKKAHPLFSRLFRSKGEFSLATRPFRAGEWSQAGAMLTLSGGRPWFVTIPESEYITGNKDIDALVAHDIAQGGEWGDRRQEIVFIGEKLDIPGIENALNECLLNDEEMKIWERIMRNKRTGREKKMERLADVFDDGFPDWPEDEQEGHEGHDHGPGEHHFHHGAKKAALVNSKGGAAR